MKINRNIKSRFMILAILLVAINLTAQKKSVKQDTLQIQILQMDSILFNLGFNDCNLEIRNSIIKEGFEFYDDREGLNSSYKVLNESFVQRCSNDVKMTRELVSSEIYPLKYYGAVQFGIHKFYIDGVLKDTAKFIHIWKQESNSWILPRIISYGHSHSDYTINSNVKDEIHKMDSLLFQVAFNQCDLEVHKSIMIHGQEFYDDRQGLMVSHEIGIESFINRCSKDFKVTRKLVKDEIYTVNNYGALQIGEHQFYVDGILEENAKFVHLWKKENGTWVLPRIISYEHKATTE